MPRVFTASTEVALSCPDRVMQRLCAHFSEFGAVTVDGRCRRIDTGFGTADVEDCGRCLKICAVGKDESALAYVKLALAEHLLNFAEETPVIVWQGDGMAGSPLPYFREMQVDRIADVTPHMRRLTLTGSDLARFASGGLHVRLLLPKDRAAPPAWPVMGADGRPEWPQERPDVRIYTLRRVDVERGEVDIDFVMHHGDHMPGACFAAQAKPGDIVGMTGPGGGATPEADWYLLAGDETALPAISRILEALPANAHAVVRIEIADSGEIQPLRSAASLDLQWVCRDGLGAGWAELLPDAVRAVELPQDHRRRFVWVGCEFRDFKEIRGYLRKELKLPREEHLAVAYWRRGFAGDEARKDAL